MKKFLITAVFAFIGFLVFAQDKIAVFPFEDMDNVFTGNEAALFYRNFINEFANRGRDNFTVLPRQDVEKLIDSEANFQLGNYSARAKTAEWEKVLNGTQILHGAIGKFGNSIQISVSLYTFPDLRQLPGGIDMSVASKNELLGKIPELVQRMLTELVGTTNRIYNIGEIGPAGGIVFHDKGFFSDGWRYLEAAPSTAELCIVWDADTAKYFYLDIYFQDMESGEIVDNPLGLGSEVGTGKRNTQKIVDALNRQGISNDPAQICALMYTNGFRDWFLPSYAELKLLYENLKKRGLGSFSNGWYCSSSKAGDPWSIQNFEDGQSRYAGRGGTYLIRAVRQF